MNKFKISLLALTATLSLNTFGASIDHIQNYSAEYGANPAQQGAINVGSTVYFNPAGLMRLENGTYFVGGVQVAFGEQKMHSNNKDYDTDLFSPIPNFAIYKKDDNGAFFWTLGGVGGGAALEYKNGIPLGTIGELGLALPLPPNLASMEVNTLLSGTKVEGSNMYGQMTLGRAFNLTDKWSASFGVRGVYAIRDLKASTHFNGIPQIPNTKLPIPAGDASIDSERTASGIGVQFGLNYAPTEKLNIGFRYDSKVRLNFKTDATINDSTLNNMISNGLLGKFPVYADGLKTRRDLPAIAALGASYKVTDTWTTFIGGNYYFNESATMDRVGSMNVDYDNGWEISLGSELWVNEKVAWLVGFNYADTGASGESYSPTEYAIDSSMVGTGIKYRPNETTEWTVAYNHYFYDTTSFGGVEYSKEISSIGVNFVKKF